MVDELGVVYCWVGVDLIIAEVWVTEVGAKSPVVVRVPVRDEVPARFEVPVTVEVSVRIELPVEVELLIRDKIPIMGKVPVRIEFPVGVELPVLDKTPVSGKVPVVRGTVLFGDWRTKWDVVAVGVTCIEGCFGHFSESKKEYWIGVKLHYRIWSI